MKPPKDTKGILTLVMKCFCKEKRNQLILKNCCFLCSLWAGTWSSTLGDKFRMLTERKPMRDNHNKAYKLFSDVIKAQRESYWWP